MKSKSTKTIFGEGFEHCILISPRYVVYYNKHIKKKKGASKISINPFSCSDL